jgi:tRNA (guanine26-N2/guanine27-N2)-dimethyltransferase
LSASGLRALRYAREIEGIGQVVALDNDLASVEACQRNIKFNGSVAISKVESHHTDARVHMLTHPKEFDVVDLDPYGSPSIFLDSAIQSVTDGGLLMCTATDMAVLCGGNGEVCYSKYGSYPLRAKYCHEMALRILLASIESHANRYKRYIVPVLSVQMDFYVRVFVRVYTSASAMKNTPLKLSYVYQCIGCDSFHLQPVGRSLPKNNSVRYLPAIGPVVKQDCNHCGKKYNMGGPIWSAPMHDPEWVTSILNSVKSMKDRYPAYDRISAVLTTVSEELLDVPLFLSLHNLCATLKCISPSAAMFRSAVINANYRISGTHVNPLGMKTDAPMEVIWDIMRCWVKNHPIKAQSPEQPGSVILSKEPSHEVDFSRHIGSLSKAQAKKVARFLPNPEKHWGPKLRAGRQITSKHVSLIGHEAVNGHLSQHHEELKEEDEEAEPEDNVQDKVDPKRQKTATDNITST